MATIKLNNGTRKNSVVGQLVRVDPNNPRNFIAVDINAIDVIGTVDEVKGPGNPTTIKLLNTIRWADIIDPVSNPVPGGSGDMLASVYDPDNIADDAFDMDNMKNGSTNKIVTDTEKLAWNDNLPSSSFSGLAKITVGTSAPVAPGVGDIWIDSTP